MKDQNVQEGPFKIKTRVNHIPKIRKTEYLIYMTTKN